VPYFGSFVNRSAESLAASESGNFATSCCNVARAAASVFCSICV
jgi:hypothetical protein